MIYILVIPVLVSLVLFTTLAIIEEYLLPRLKPTSKFRNWWRNHIIGTSEKYED
jgi:thiosulfate reductase cytochrome b subunit